MATPSYAYKKETKWQRDIKSIQAETSPIAKKLYMWLNVTQNKEKFSTKNLIAFTRENPDWPQMYKFNEIIEDGVGVYLPAAEEIKWFHSRSPRTYKGANHYLDTLIEQGKTEAAKRHLNKFWIKARLDKKETMAFAKKYKALFTKADHSARINNLLWNRRYTEAKRMFSLVNKNAAQIAKARIALGRLSYKASSLVNALSKEQQMDAGIIYDRVKWRRRMKKDSGALDMLKRQPQKLTHSKKWWTERNILSRRFIEKGKYAKAYDLISKHGMTSKDKSYAQAEWLLGWISLSFLNKQDRAYRHFENFYQSVTSAISRARAAYWLGRSDDAMGREIPAQNWYKLASYFPSTFYGQLAHEKVYGHVDSSQFLDNQTSMHLQSAFYKKDLVKAIQLLAKHDLHRYTEPFFKKLLKQAKKRADYIMIAQLAIEAKQIQYAVEANKVIQQKLGTFLFIAGYPLLDTTPDIDIEKALTHAIVYRESMFNQKAISSAGARGLMQLMPATARGVSRKIRKKYSRHKLTANPFYNLQLGSKYISQMLKRYDGSYPLAIAAYNAGPRNVRKWIKKFGDPRDENIDIIDWMEQIPVYETRNYVQRVMETYYIYKIKFSEKPKTVFNYKKTPPLK